MLASVLVEILTVSIGFLIYASPSHSDQEQGKSITAMRQWCLHLSYLRTRRGKSFMRTVIFAPLLLFLS